MPSGKTLAIGDLSRSSGLSAKTLRYYDEIGLLTPRWRNPVTGFREYAKGALETLRLIDLGKRAGLSLERIAELLSAVRKGRGVSAIRSILDRHRAVLDRQLRALRDLRRLLHREAGRRSRWSP